MEKKKKHTIPFAPYLAKGIPFHQKTVFKEYQEINDITVCQKIVPHKVYQRIVYINPITNACNKYQTFKK